MTDQRSPPGADPTLEQKLAVIATELLVLGHVTGEGWYSDPVNRTNWRFRDARSLLSGNGMLEIIAALAQREWIVEATHWPKPNSGYAECRLFTVKGTRHYAQGDTLPEAVVRAAYEALNH